MVLVRSTVRAEASGVLGAEGLEAKDRGDMTFADSPTALEARVSGRSHC